MCHQRRLALLSSATERLEVARLVRAIPRQRVWPLRPLPARSDRQQHNNSAPLTDRVLKQKNGCGEVNTHVPVGPRPLRRSWRRRRRGVGAVLLEPAQHTWPRLYPSTKCGRIEWLCDGLDLLLGDRHAVLVQLRALLLLARRVVEGQPNQPLRQLQRQVRPAGKPPARGS